MRAIKRSIAQARDDREARDREARDRAARERELHEASEVHEIELIEDRSESHARETTDSATCERVTRELTTRIDLARSLPSSDRPRPLAPSSPANSRRDIAPLRCEPCPRVIPSRRMFDGSLLQQFQCDGTCVRDEERARARARVHAARHAQLSKQASIASRYELRAQIAITTVLAVLAAMWIALAAREASADARTRDVAETEDDVDDDDDDAIDVAAPPSREPPFGAPVVAPPIAGVLAAAYRTAGLDRDLGRGFVRRSRLAGLVPLLTVRTGRDTNWRDDDSNVSRGVTIEVRATWRLDRLVFDGRELQVAALDGARRRERRRLAARVIQVYFAWKRAARAVGMQPRAAALAERAAAELDDLTDGWFTEAREGPPP